MNLKILSKSNNFEVYMYKNIIIKTVLYSLYERGWNRIV